MALTTVGCLSEVFHQVVAQLPQCMVEIALCGKILHNGTRLLKMDSEILHWPVWMPYKTGSSGHGR